MFMASVLYGKIGDNAYLNSYSEEFGVPPQDPSISNNFFYLFFTRESGFVCLKPTLNFIAPFMSAETRFQNSCV